MLESDNFFVRILGVVALSMVIVVAGCVPADATDTTTGFRVGVAKCEITPREPLPMWGYGSRHAQLSQGVLDPLFATAIVMEAGTERLAIVALDLGRGPTSEMMRIIRRDLAEKAGIRHVLISGSHTHHGPVIELTDREGYGQGPYDAAVQYAQRLPQRLVELVLEAHDHLRPASVGAATKPIALNRNRHSKRADKPIDSALSVLRFDDADGKPIAVLVNFAAHPVLADRETLKFSADYPGFMRAAVEEALDTTCLFMPGAAGDLSPAPPAGVQGPQAYGQALAAEVTALARSIQTTVPERPSIEGRTEQLTFRSRVDYSNYLIVAALERSFFPELVQNYLQEYRDGIRPELNTVVLNGSIALVGGSGEFFCEHAIRLKSRCWLPTTLFLGYCNGYHQYFPTIEAAAQGGYGADPLLAPAELGAGERMIDRALITIGALGGRFPADAISDPVEGQKQDAR